MIYNTEQKLQFLSSIDEEETSKDAYLVLFGKLYDKVEKEFDKDICDMSYDELEIAITLLGGRDVKSVAWNISRLKKYVNWCIVNGKTERLENYLEFISPNDIDNSYIYKIEMLKNHEHLAEILDVVYPSIMDLHLANIYRIYCWLLYDGLTNEEAVVLKRNQIDLKNGIIRLENKEVQINPIFRGLLEVTLYEDKLTRGVRGGKLQFFDLYPTDYILRMFKQTEVNREKQFGAKITQLNVKYKEETGEYIRLSPTRVYESGVFYRWHQLELNNEPVPFDKFIEDDIDGKEFSIDKRYIFAKKRNDVEQSYNMWKKAFGY